MEIKLLPPKLLLHSGKVFPQQILPVKIKEARKLINLHPLLKTREVYRIYRLFDQGKIVPNEAIHDNCLFIIRRAESSLKSELSYLHLILD